MFRFDPFKGQSNSNGAVLVFDKFSYAVMKRLSAESRFE